MNDYELSIHRMSIVNNALEELSSQFIFIGGAVVGLYSTKQESINTRPTKDIDILAKTLSLANYEELENLLRKKGFRNDTHSNVICRWILRGVNPITVDVMSANPRKFGFTNQWYEAGIEHSISHEIGTNNSIIIFSAVYFLATKIEAYNNRGREDCLMDNDFEDIVYIIGNRESLLEELKASENDVKKFIIENIKTLLDKDIEECIYALGPDIGGDEGAAHTYELMQSIAQL